MPTRANGLRTTIAGVVDGFLDGWYTFDADKAFADFETDFPGFLYQPLNQERPVDDPAAYLQSVRDGDIKEFRELRWANIEHDDLGDFLWAYIDLVQHAVGHDGSESRGAYRASLFMARLGDGWKVVHYHESAQPYALRPRRVGGPAPSRPEEKAPSLDTLAAIKRAQETAAASHGDDPETASLRMLETF
ncbi:MAG TPA: nuclear transport factor 2 family protein, partial [Dehalococcoidia bacterium]|nr:nuclear transport factor 2 family protein [Dehalococcoidia bacterium]